MANVTEMTEWADLPEMLTIDEVADYMRYSRKTIRRMIDDGRLRGVMLGRSWRIPSRRSRRCWSRRALHARSKQP